ncbi:trypsin-like peptidase domain-containing protein [Streptomyces sp. BK239]|uniref:trypsin-like peptidase domain-containing protein n=1 Tax=Streptomyces sp. BK239 TaxID=2512155 RepID=UPI00102C05A2|nr:trypsin-like peptidase domain-containing protein [Streptomyces sp. BK239]RZU12866.1 putative serine protease PepD [Streptomyces sp. BK239]
MDEGKPTKAKWWNRPRPEPRETPDGDFRLADPNPLPEPPAATQTDQTEAPAGGAASQPTAPAGVAAGRPGAPIGVPLDQPTASVGVPLDQPWSSGDTADQPGPREGVPVDRAEALAGASAQAGAPTGVPADQPQSLAGSPVDQAGALDGVPGARSADVSEGGAVGQVDSAAPVGEPLGPLPTPPPGDVRPKPLHDPDAYSTPPYGEPGPWAPAPPVQHPAAAHAQDTPPAAPLPPPEPGAPAPEVDASPEAADPWYRYDPWAAPGGASASAGPLQQTGAAVLSRDQRRRRARKALVGGALGIALVSGLLGGFVGAQLERNGGLDTVKLPQASAAPAGRDADSIAGIAARALPSVVTLHVSGSAESGTGTGFVLDTRGHILTNEHVVAPAGSDGEISVVFNGGQTARAEIVGKDSGYDLAVVKVSGVRGLTPLPLGNSDNVRVGDPVVAIGAPFDLEGTVTSGIISARERPITAGGERGDGSDVSYVDALQTDAPINPGNSGGPLLDAHGQVVGINSAIRSAVDGSDADGGQAGSIGLGFAIPVNQGRRVAEELINTGRATHPVIGVTLDMDYTGDGARVRAEGGDGGLPVTPGGPGDRAGIRAGDVITAIDGRRVHSGEELIVKTRAHRPGDRMKLTVRRDGEDRTLTLVLGSSGGSE